MPKKYYFQLGQDAVMTAVLLALFAYHLFAEAVHEWLGLAFSGLIISHLSLNTWWLKKLPEGQYDAYRLLKTGLNAVLFLLFLTACISGILLSKHIFAELPFHQTSDGIRKIHMLSTHWIQLVIAIHLGLHWKALATLLSNIFKIDLNGFCARAAAPFLWLALTAYGVYAFIRRDLFPYLINRVDFAFFDTTESPVRFFTDYFAMLIAAAYLTRIGVWWFFFRKAD